VAQKSLFRTPAVTITAEDEDEDEMPLYLNIPRPRYVCYKHLLLLQHVEVAVRTMFFFSVSYMLNMLT
jgi:hypothetical protein